MVVMHMFLSEGVYNWIKNAPLPTMEEKAAAPVEEKKAEEEDEGSF